MSKESDTSELDKPSDKQEGGGDNLAQWANLDVIADNLSDTMPEVQEHAIEQENLNENAKVAQYSHLKDRDGNSFDPEIHRTNAQGEPVLSSTDKLIKKPGRKKNTQNPSTSHQSYVAGASPEDKAKAQGEAQRQQMRATGAMTANMIMTMGVALGGDEWQPRKDDAIGLDEKTMLEAAFADYFEATGKTDLPPGIVLSVALAGYAGPRFFMPKTQSRISKLTGGIRKWWANRKLKKHKLRAEPIEDDTDDNKVTTLRA